MFSKKIIALLFFLVLPMGLLFFHVKESCAAMVHVEGCVYRVIDNNMSTKQGVNDVWVEMKDNNLIVGTCNEFGEECSPATQADPVRIRYDKTRYQAGECENGNGYYYFPRWIDESTRASEYDTTIDMCGLSTRKATNNGSEGFNCAYNPLKMTVPSQCVSGSISTACMASPGNESQCNGYADYNTASVNADATHQAPNIYIRVTATPTPAAWPVAGRVVDANATASGISGVTIRVYNGSGGSQTTTTDSQGNFSLSGFINHNDSYAVRIEAVPDGWDIAERLAYGKNGNMSWTWQTYWSRDTLNTEQSYEHQQLGNSDCAGNHGGLGDKRCNFTLVAEQPIPPSDPSGDIEATDCTISAEGGSCDVTITWSAENVAGVEIYEHGPGALSQGNKIFAQGTSNVLGASTLAQSDWGSSIYTKTTTPFSGTITRSKSTVGTYTYTLAIYPPPASISRELDRDAARVRLLCAVVTTTPMPTVGASCVGQGITYYSAPQPISADEKRTIVSSSSGLDLPWACDSGWVNSTGGAFSCTALTTDRYYISSMIRDVSAPEECVAPSSFPTPTGYVDVDVDAPSTPVTPVASMNATTKNITFNWSPSTDGGCANCSGYAYNYWLQGRWSNGDWFINDGNIRPAPVCSASHATTQTYTQPTPAATTTPGMSCATRAGQTIYLKVRQANDTAGNFSEEQTLEGSYTCPTPTLYPTAVITGAVKEYLGASCGSPIYAAPTIGVTPASPAGVSSSCTTTAGSYTCNITFNNQTNPSVVHPQNFTVFANAPAYTPSTGYLVAGGSCSESGATSVSVDVGNSVNRDVLFGANTPWVKVKNSSVSSLSSLSNFIPASATALDGDDDSSTNFVLTQAGVVGANSSMSLVPTPISSPEWQYDSAGRQVSLNHTSYLDYVRARKEYKTVTSFGEIETGKINVFSGGVTVNDGDVASFNSKNTVVIVTGTLTMNAATFKPTSANIAFIASAITFGDNTSEVEGVFVADSINTGSNSNLTLKVRGNLASLTASGFTLGRAKTSNTTPSVFIIGNATPFVTLLDDLSVAAYDWRQLQ